MATNWGDFAARERAAAQTKTEQTNRMKLAEEAFKKAHNGKTAQEYVFEIERIVASEVAVGGSRYGELRSERGQEWTEVDKPATGKNKSVIAYHEAETAAKKLAGKGDLLGALKKLDEAAELRRKYDETLGGADASHSIANAVLRKRSASLKDVGVTLKADKRITDARLEVTNFYQKLGLQPPMFASVI